MSLANVFVFVSLLCSLQSCVFLSSFNFLYFLDVFPPDVATCYQLPASIDHTHLVPVSQFQPVSDFLFQLFLRHLSIISCRLTFVSRSRAVNENLLHLFFSVSGFVFHTSVSPMTADRLKGNIFMTFKFFNIQASLDSVTVSLFV